MDEVVTAALVGVGLGYAVRASQKQILRAGRALARNQLVTGTARRGRDVVVAGAKGTVGVAQAGARGALDVAQAGVKGGVHVVQAGAEGGVLVAAAATGRLAGTGRQRGDVQAPSRMAQVPVSEERPSARRGAKGGTAARPRSRAATARRVSQSG